MSDIISKRWQLMLLDDARRAATKSKDTTKVGALLLSGKTSLLSAFNGIPEGVEDLPERMERPEKYEWVSHAEHNIVCFAARHGIATEGKSILVTHFPCHKCMDSIIQAGIRTVYYGGGQTVGDFKTDIATAKGNDAKIKFVHIDEGEQE